MAIEDLRMRARELALAYQKLAEQELARREFLTNIAHELRTPLMAASGYIQILEKGMLNDKQFPKAIATVSKHIQQIVSLVNDILFMQEMELVLPEFRPVNLQEVVARVLDEYQSRAKAREIEFHVISDPELPIVLGDSKSLERALSALVDNAVNAPSGWKGRNSAQSQ